MTTATRLLLALLLVSLAACSGRPDRIAGFTERPGNQFDRQGRFNGVFVGEGREASCTAPGGETRAYDPPVVAGVIDNGTFIGNLDGCRVEMNVYTDGVVQGWTFIRTHRFIPITYTLFDGRFEGPDRIVGRFDQVMQGSEASCSRGPVVMERRDIGEALATADATVADAIEFFSPSTRCRTGGIQFP